MDKKRLQSIDKRCISKDMHPVEQQMLPTKNGFEQFYFRQNKTVDGCVSTTKGD